MKEKEGKNDRLRNIRIRALFGSLFAFNRCLWPADFLVGQVFLTVDCRGIRRQTHFRRIQITEEKTKESIGVDVENHSRAFFRIRLRDFCLFFSGQIYGQAGYGDSASSRGA